MTALLMLAQSAAPHGWAKARCHPHDHVARTLEARRDGMPNKGSRSARNHGPSWRPGPPSSGSIRRRMPYNALLASPPSTHPVCGSVGLRHADAAVASYAVDNPCFGLPWAKTWLRALNEDRSCRFVCNRCCGGAMRAWPAAHEALRPQDRAGAHPHQALFR